MKQDLDTSVFIVTVLTDLVFEASGYNKAFTYHFATGQVYHEDGNIPSLNVPAIFIPAIQRSITTKQVTAFRHISLKGTDKLFWFTQILPLTFDTTKTQYLCISENITRLEVYEDDFVKSKILLDRLYEIFPAAIFIIGDNGDVLECNIAAQKIFGYSKEAFLAMNVFDPPADVAIFREDHSILPSTENPLATSLSQRLSIENKILGLSANNGPVLWIQLSCTVLPVPGYGIVCTCRNITSRQNQAQKILDSKKILQGIINSSFDTILFLDTNLKIVWYNTEAENKIIKLLGNKIPSGEYAEYILNDDPREKLEFYIAEARQKKIHAYEHCVTTAYGEELWYYRRYHPAYDDHGAYIGCVIISTNITERKQKEFDIQKQNQQLRDISRVQSHELRRPLVNIMSLVALLQDEAEKEIDIDLLSQITANAEALDEVILKITRRTKQG